jgi:hypothetical protein
MTIWIAGPFRHLQTFEFASLGSNSDELQRELYGVNERSIQRDKVELDSEGLNTHKNYGCKFSHIAV